jgi:hypothetical protein
MQNLQWFAVPTLTDHDGDGNRRCTRWGNLCRVRREHFLGNGLWQILHFSDRKPVTRHPCRCGGRLLHRPYLLISSVPGE